MNEPELRQLVSEAIALLDENDPDHEKLDTRDWLRAARDTLNRHRMTIPEDLGDPKPAQRRGQNLARLTDAIALRVNRNGSPLGYADRVAIFHQLADELYGNLPIDMPRLRGLAYGETP